MEKAYKNTISLKENIDPTVKATQISAVDKTAKTATVTIKLSEKVADLTKAGNTLTATLTFDNMDNLNKKITLKVDSHNIDIKDIAENKLATQSIVVK